MSRLAEGCRHDEFSICAMTIAHRNDVVITNWPGDFSAIGRLIAKLCKMVKFEEMGGSYSARLV